MSPASDLIRFASYLETQAGYYTERVHLKAGIHTMPLRVEALAALMAGLACLHKALGDEGEVGSFRTVVNDCVNEIADAADRPTE